MSKFNWLRNDPNVRDQLYTLAIALVALGTAYNLYTGEIAQAWIVVLAAGFAIAKKNVK